jgi:hypothetical protein
VGGEGRRKKGGRGGEKNNEEREGMGGNERRKGGGERIGSLKEVREKREGEGREAESIIST